LEEDNPAGYKSSDDEWDDDFEPIESTEQCDAWEDEVEVVESVSQNVMQFECRGWSSVRDGIKAYLRKASKTLSVSQLNQLIILQCFANLRVKGERWMEASRQIAYHWYADNGTGSHFARRVRKLARPLLEHRSITQR
jgi:hypothetical protein